MITKEQIKATMEVMLETFPKLKEEILENKPFDIRKEKDGWICFIDTNINQFDQHGSITTKFDLDGSPYEMSVSDFGRLQRG
ncbi:hypothetical protein AB4Y90_01435 [Chryseobacterium sp. 2TAF14]|uniref:hypothetical protein n=1 Tax=Chryseobacterium sp. 2TAF14 TaxID=3233007 RepID=UPI003F8E8DC2